jgi:heme/copper-type cytochrome/quinol oxidase subunit 3
MGREEWSKPMSDVHVGTYLFLFSESIFFVFLLVAYINFHLGPAHGSMAHDLDVLKTATYTAFLLLSSGTAWRAHSAFLRGRTERFQAWLIATIILGLIFIYGQASEYLRLFEKEITISRDPLSTSFFTVTGFHGLHVCAGVLLFIMLLSWSMMQKRSSRAVPTGSVVAISLYWHFVDIVWIAVFAIVYLWGTK